MSVQGFTNIVQGPLAQYLQVSQKIGGDVSQQSQLVHQAFNSQLQFLQLASQSGKPANQNDLMTFLKPTSDSISAIQNFREAHRTSTFFNHLSAISESIPALGWVAVIMLTWWPKRTPRKVYSVLSPTPAPYVKEMNDAGQFYTNRVLKDWKETNKNHVDWVKSWIQTLTELQSFVKQFHTTGLVWGGKGTAAAPPPPCAPLPPPPIADFSAAPLDPGVDRSALFAQLNQGSNITSHLKKVTPDMQTHKNSTLKQVGPVPFKGSDGSSSFGVEKPPTFIKDGKKWIIENQKGNHQLLVENTEMSNVAYLYKCSDSTVIIKGKINSITMDSCKKTAVVVDSLVSVIEFINCQSVQMQVFGKVPTISIDKTDGCQIYLSRDSLDVEIVSAKSSEMNVLIPKGDSDYVEVPIPEQFKTTILPNNTLSTIVVENKG